ncbi:helix-turn-helix domain-containing protein [Arthrobacter ginkgonis]
MRHFDVRQVSYRPAAKSTAGVELLLLEELRRRMRQHPQADTAQRTDFHLLISVETGLLRHMVDFTDYAVGPETWLWVRPGQIQQFRDLRAATGQIVLFQPGFLDPATVAETRVDDPFGRTYWQLSREGAAAVRLALDHLAAEFRPRAPVPEAVRAPILRHLLAVLLLRLVQETSQTGTAILSPAEAFVRFRDAVETGFTRTRNVNDYARTLGYSPRTLTRTTMASAGMGAKEFIDQRVVLEAKRMLVHSNDAVGQVAAQLGFDDASNFVKYFTQRQGVTPAAFRQGIRFGKETCTPPSPRRKDRD